MDEKNKNDLNNGFNPDGQNNDTANRNTNESNSNNDSSSDQSHYYSYGPFQSLSKDKDGEEVRQEPAQETRKMEMTPSQSSRPVYPTNATPPPRTDHIDSLNGNHDDNNGNRKTSQFQYNRPKTSAKTVIASILAGMLIMTAGMFGADRANLFTPESESTTTTNIAPASAVTTDNSVTQAALPAGSADVAEVAKSASPAVVKIETLSKSGAASGGNNPYNDPAYRFFFGDQGGGSNEGGGNGGDSSGGSSGSLTPLGIGSGFIFDKSGYILTNAHVVGEADVIQVTLENNKTPYTAKLMGKSTDLDLAVLKIEPKSGETFPSVTLGNSDNVAIGSWLVAIGNPQGFDHTVTAGVLSAKERSITASDASNGQSTDYTHLLQTDASINPGNSGGPLLNMNGQVIGMNTAVSEDAQGIGFAIPSNVILNVVDQLKKGEKIPTTPVPFIGASLMSLTAEVSKQLGIDTTEGSVVTEVLYRSPAYQADLRSYDVITGINGTKYTNSQDLVAAIQKLKVGDSATLNVIRNGKTMDLKVTIGNRNDFDTTSPSTGGTGQ
ncbi:trypsin-like peptidase domain-containing protein [Paenibacillus sp. KACC 21273]|uniref:S1C family serine protease n=1 Tax=Paenibacillus sp. KACC 21273 TaxID=3025665 RepID=UPI00236601BC|nr:trypsin-like peptidase domain-containing protein [Paenibacillus sp. KACC 21273]WDF49677.1 trypsin-like peptidase domain-containing protein [Paenibacillus sp. KACC 21273]